MNHHHYECECGSRSHRNGICTKCQKDIRLDTLKMEKDKAVRDAIKAASNG